MYNIITRFSTYTFNFYYKLTTIYSIQDIHGVLKINRLHSNTEKYINSLNNQFGNTGFPPHSSWLFLRHPVYYTYNKLTYVYRIFFLSVYASFSVSSYKKYRLKCGLPAFRLYL